MIEEKISIKRESVWASPINPPTKIDEKMISMYKLRFEQEFPQTIKRGLIFWIVNKIKRIIQGHASPTLISHLWKGAAPNLIESAIKTNIPKKESTTPKILRVEPKINKIDANVWVKKYLIAASLLNLSFTTKSKGIKDKVFNSNPNHEINKDGAETTNNTLIKILTTNKKIEGESHIGKEVKPINGAWAH